MKSMKPMKPTLHEQGGYIYLMCKHYTLGIYTDWNRAKEGLVRAYEAMKG